MFKFASLYGIGKMIKRTPIYLNSERCIYELKQEIESIFPIFYQKINFLDVIFFCLINYLFLVKKKKINLFF